MRLALVNTRVRNACWDQVRLTCNYRFGHQVRWVKSFDRQSVLAQITDEELEDGLLTYFWLAMKTPNSHSNRLRGSSMKPKDAAWRPWWSGPNCVPPTSLPE
jgi:hypothetical protein